MQDIFVIIVSVLGIIGLSVLIGYLKSKGIFKKSTIEDVTDNAKDAVKLAKLILEVAPINKNIKNKSTIIFNIADIVSDYLYDSNVGNVNRKQLALETANEILKTVGITPTPQEKKLMEQLIFESFKWIENSRKVSS